MKLDAVCDRIREDYATFPKNQSFDLYAEDVFFRDPLNKFNGVDRYRDMIGFIDRWFQAPNLELHELKTTGEATFETRWTLKFVCPVPWKPLIAIPGWTEYRLNETGKIVSHIDYWHCSVWDVILQIFKTG